MFVMLLKLDLHIPQSNSLKHKRMILNSLKGRLRSRFNISVSEVGGLDKWQRADIAISHVSAKKADTINAADKILNFVSAFNGVELLMHETEIL